MQNNNQSNESDYNNINDNLGGMKRGRIARMWDDVMALWAMIKDPTAAWSSKAVAIGALTYLVSPLDAIPDIVPLVGLSDDVGVILAAVSALSYQLAKYRLKKN